MSWRDTILNEFVQGVSRLTLVADPDGLLTEEKLALELKEKGFDLLEFYDHIEFRYAYEVNYRSIWDRGEQTDLVVVLRLQDSKLENLPFDLLQSGRKLQFNLGTIFPNFSYPIIEKLDYQHLDDLFAAQEKYNPDRMGDNATKDFILRHVFGIAAELLQTPVDLLRCLLRCHYSSLSLPSELWNRLVHLLQQNQNFAGWPIQEIVPDALAFFSFLQERWPLFLASLDQANESNTIQEPRHVFDLEFAGPAILPFGHHDILVYIDNLFVEGKLSPIKWEKKTDDWTQCGLMNKGEAEGGADRINRLMDAVWKALPMEDCRYGGWLTFARKWAELQQLVETFDSERSFSEIEEISSEISIKFDHWLQHHYGSLINLPPVFPAMLHHVPRHLARNIEDDPNGRIVLLVVDGLSLSQWSSIRSILQEQASDKHLVIRESATFAWIPTLTSVSRQALFAGSPPFYFPSSIGSTAKESKLWRKFWESIGLSRLEVAYQKGLGDGDATQTLDDVISSRTRVLGLVIDKVDKIMHGMQLGASGMHNQITQWCNQGFLSSLVDYLLDRKYQVWLTSDHGNIACSGVGSPLEGSIAETRGERVRIYPTRELRTSISAQFPASHEWEPVGLPPHYFPLLAKDNSAFIQDGKKIVGHGGMSIEEVIVPLIKFERRSK
ncbi:MAG: BREX-3 system phosphatase PglZ [Candidatus Marinimicrobia bacterium]|nr:BREX-3 system phosphatase PglZ [Candidatus Neomarinimicrobiota bacterium]